jgi:HEAT repeat protein
VRGDMISAVRKMITEPVEKVQLAALDALATNPEAQKAAAQWFIPLLYDRNEAVRNKIFQALESMNALPADAKPQLLAGLKDADNQVRSRTAEALGSLGTSATDTIPALIQALQDDNDQVRSKATEALGKMPPTAESIAALQRTLRDKDNEVRATAAVALGAFGTPALAALPDLLEMVEHTNAHVRGNALEALAKIWATEEQNCDGRCFKVLQKGINDEDVTVREQVIPWLVGCLQKQAEPLLTNALEDEASQVRAVAAKALRALDKLEAHTNRELAERLSDDNDVVQLAAAGTLAEKGHPTPEVITGLIKLLQDTNPDVQVQGALTLSKFGEDAHAAGEALLTLSKSENLVVRQQALHSLALILPEQAIPAFLTALHDPDVNIRKIASAGLLRVQQIPETDMPNFLDGLQDPEPQVRANTALWLSRQEKLPEEAIPLFARLVSDTDDGLRLSIVRALRTATGPTTSYALNALLDDPHPQVKAEAAILLLRFTPEHTRAQQVLEMTLADPDYPQRKNLLNMLGKYATEDGTLKTVYEKWGTVPEAVTT